MFRSISDWSDKEGSSITEDEFFLKESEFPEIYDNPNKLYRKTQETLAKGEVPDKVFEKPIEQLSSKGLALMSYIYSQQDNSESQPIIASTVASYEHMVKLVAKSPPGTAVTVIFQPTDGEEKLGDYYGREFSAAHRTVCKLERDKSSVKIIHMDGTANSIYGEACKELAIIALKGSAIRPDFYFQRNPANLNKGDNKSFARQSDSYQCGVFALKDARQLNRDHGFSENMTLDTKKTEHDQHYVIPASYLKSIQSREFIENVLNKQGDQVVTRKGNTLQQTYEKHNISGYVQHFSQKYHDYVADFLEKYKDQPEMIREFVEKYDAEKMTLERLQAVYSHKIDPVNPTIQENSQSNDNKPELAAEGGLKAENAMELPDQIKHLFPDNTVADVRVGDEAIPSIIITFSDNAAYNTGIHALTGFLHHTYAMGNNTLPLSLTPALTALLGNKDQYNQLKGKVDSDYRTRKLADEREKLTAVDANKINTNPEPKKPDRSVENALDNLIKDIIPGGNPKFETSPQTASTPYESCRLNIDSYDSSTIEKIKKKLADNGMPDVIVKYSVVNNVRLPMAIIVKRQHAEAFQLFQKGLDEEKQGKYSQAVFSYQKSAEMGHIKAKTNLATHYLNGTGGLSKEKGKAFSLLSESAKSGHGRAQFNLATMLEKGDGVTRDLVQARSWYSEALKNGISIANEGLTRVNQELVHYDAINKLFPDGVKSSSIKGKEISIEFTSEPLYQEAMKIFKDNLHPGKQSNGNKLFLYVTPRLIEKLENTDNYNQMKSAIGAVYTVDRQPDASEVSVKQPVTRVSGYTDRSTKFLSEESTNKIKATLSSEGLKISGAMVNQSNNDKVRNVFDENGDQKFKININKLTTNKSDVDTFVTMLKVFQAVHGSKVLPAITTSSEQIKELWKSAMNKVYPGQELKLDSVITVKSQEVDKPLQSKPPHGAEAPTVVEAEKEIESSTRRQLK